MDYPTISPSDFFTKNLDLKKKEYVENHLHRWKEVQHVLL